MKTVESVNAIGSFNTDADSHSFPDVLLPSQFFGLLGERTISSEQRLLLAVLADAVNVIQKSGSSESLRKRDSFKEAANWIFTEGITSPLSFAHVCDALDIDAEGLRRRLSELMSGHGGALHRLRFKGTGRIGRMTVIRTRRNPRVAHRSHSVR
jgi:hypothetical protein